MNDQNQKKLFVRVCWDWFHKDTYFG